jgi:hypothetical protein
MYTSSGTIQSDSIDKHFIVSFLEGICPADPLFHDRRQSEKEPARLSHIRAGPLLI